jgi:hypothetical protein
MNLLPLILYIFIFLIGILVDYIGIILRQNPFSIISIIIHSVNIFWMFLYLAYNFFDIKEKKPKKKTKIWRN